MPENKPESEQKTNPDAPSAKAAPQTAESKKVAITPGRVVDFILAVAEVAGPDGVTRREPVVRPATCVSTSGPDVANFQVAVDGLNDEGHLRHGETRSTNGGVMPSHVWRTSAKFDDGRSEENTWSWPRRA